METPIVDGLCQYFGSLDVDPEIPEWVKKDFEKLGEAHDTWLNKMNNVLVLDGGKDWTEPDTAENILMAVKTFIKNMIRRDFNN